ncbi:MAG TPA: LysE family translocator [Acidiphilium sp.]
MNDVRGHGTGGHGKDRTWQRFSRDGVVSVLPALIPFAVAMVGSPGPNNTMLTASGATFGLRRTVPHAMGVAIGFPAMMVAIGLGAGPILVADPVVHRWLVWIGAAYMAWLAWRVATARRPDAHGKTGDKTGRSRPMTFFEAVLFQWVNPKAWVIAAAAIGTFVDPASSLWLQIGMIAAVFVVIDVPIASAWAGIGSGVGSLLRSERQFRAFNLAMAALLALSIVLLFYE